MYKKFSDFLLKGDLLSLMLAVYLGSVLQDFFNEIVSGAIMPIIIAFFPHFDNKHFSQININIGNAQIAIGSIIMASVNVLIAFIMAYSVVKYVFFKYL